MSQVAHAGMLRAEDRASVVDHHREAEFILHRGHGEHLDPVLRAVGDGLGQGDEMPVGFLFHGADLFNVGHEGPAAAIEDGDLGTVHLDEGVVDAAPVQGGEEVFRGVDPCAVLFEGGAATGFHDKVAICRHARRPVEVHALEDIAVVRIGRMYGQLGRLSGV